MPEAWPLIGRGAECDEIHSLIRDGRGAVVAGPAGVGKSRLLEEVAGALANDWHVERVVGTPAISELPLAAFAFLDEPATVELGRFPTPLGSARRALLERGGGQRLLLVIDDAQFLDDASAALAYQLAVSGDAIVTATVRSTDRSPDAVVALWKNERCERIELQSLARREVDQLVEAVLGSRVDPETRRALWDASQGNLLYLRELIRDGLRSGVLYNDGAWRWNRPQRPPASVRELISRQVDSLPAEARYALELVAHAEPLEWTLLTAVVPEAIVDELANDGHVVATSDGHRIAARLSHPLVADVLRADVPDARRQRLFADLVDALPALTQRRTDLLRHVTWLVDAGREVAPEDLVEAARRTMLHDASRAESLATLAREGGAGRAADVVLAQVLMFGNRADEAEELLASLVTASPDDDVAVSVMRANNLTFGMYEPARAVALLQELLERVDDDARSRYLHSQQLPMLLFTGRARAVIDGVDTLLGEPKVEPADRLRAVVALIPALAVTGRPETAVRAAEAAQSLVVDARRELPYAPGQLAAGAVLALQWAGRLDDAEAIARLGYEHGTELDAALLRGVSAYQLGLCAYWRGAMQIAQDHLEEAVAVMRQTDVGFLPSACDHLAAARACLGSHESADAVVDASARFPLYETERVRLAGAIAAAGGDLAGARELTARASVIAREHELHMLELFALWDHARSGGLRAVVDDVERAAARCEGALAPIVAAATRAWADSDAATLERSAADFELLGFLLWASEMSRVAAHAFADDGLLARAAGADARADQLLARCEGASTLLSGRGPDRDIPALTRREREIAEFAVRGVTNAEIAHRLSISVRTVETHLQHVYGKLGLSSRRDLAVALGR